VLLIHKANGLNPVRQNKDIAYFIPLYIQQDATFTQFIYIWYCSTCFGWYHHPSSGTRTTVFTASGICHTVAATCRYNGS